jgi:hypothetical protein
VNAERRRFCWGSFSTLNAHLRQCCFLFSDEAYAPNDRRAEGSLKRLITEDTLTIEQKHRDPIQVPNLLHIIMASNNEWVVPARAHERRFVVQQVSNEYIQDQSWFAPLYQQMRNGGYAAMLHDLLNVNICGWHPREIIRTAALAKQQEASLSPLEEFWLELLQTGVLIGANDAEPHRAISNSYEDEYTDNDGVKRKIRHDGLYDQARASSPRLRGASDAALGRFLAHKDQGCSRAWVRRHRGWEFPPLLQCRKRWLERYPDQVWQLPDLTEWDVEG